MRMIAMPGWLRGWIAAAGLMLIPIGAASAAPPAFDRSLLGEVRQAVQGEVTVRTAVPDAKEIKAIFGFPIIEKGVQPVFVEIQNDGDAPLWYMPITTDETYFAPLEVAWRFRDPLEPKTGVEAAQAMTRLAMPLSIPAHATVSGFVFTHLETGLKFLTFGMLKGGDEIEFRFIVPVSGPAYLGEKVDFATLYKPGEIRNVDLPGLRAAIEALPCCTTNADGTKKGDPLNLVVVGDLPAIFAFTSRDGAARSPQRHRHGEILRARLAI
jgi:hypothetical protein